MMQAQTARMYDGAAPQRSSPVLVLGLFVIVLATLFFGEVWDFYDRFWWWDIFLHGGSAVGFGLIGFVMVFILFQGDRYAAPPWAMGLFAFCFAMTTGAIWEVFEFAMDEGFGMNMQKSGLVDTMTDIIVNALGGVIGGDDVDAILAARLEQRFEVAGEGD